MLRAKPSDLIYTVETISASLKEYDDPTTLDNLARAIQADAIDELYKTVSTSGHKSPKKEIREKAGRRTNRWIGARVARSLTCLLESTLLGRHVIPIL